MSGNGEEISLQRVVESITIDEADVLSSIDKLKSTLSAGPDYLPPLLFKKLKYCLCKPLAILFTQMISVAFVPSEWLNAIIIPVFKKGVSGKPSNYRPISLTCVLSKIVERILSRRIFAHLQFNDILHSS